MGIFSPLLNIFRRKKEPAMEEPVVENLPESIPPYDLSEDTAIENFRAKIDLITTQLDTLKTQYDVLNGRLANIEKMVREMYEMAKH